MKGVLLCVVGLVSDFTAVLLRQCVSHVSLLSQQCCRITHHCFHIISYHSSHHSSLITSHHTHHSPLITSYHITSLIISLITHHTHHTYSPPAGRQGPHPRVHRRGQTPRPHPRQGSLFRRPSGHRQDLHRQEHRPRPRPRVLSIQRRRRERRLADQGPPAHVRGVNAGQVDPLPEDDEGEQPADSNRRGGQDLGVASGGGFAGL